MQKRIKIGATQTTNKFGEKFGKKFKPYNNRRTPYNNGRKLETFKTK